MALHRKLIIAVNKFKICVQFLLTSTLLQILVEFAWPVAEIATGIRHNLYGWETIITKSPENEQFPNPDGMINPAPFSNFSPLMVPQPWIMLILVNP